MKEDAWEEGGCVGGGRMCGRREDAWEEGGSDRGRQTMAALTDTLGKILSVPLKLVTPIEGSVRACVYTTCI